MQRPLRIAALTAALLLGCSRGEPAGVMSKDEALSEVTQSGAPMARDIGVPARALEGNLPSSPETSPDPANDPRVQGPMIIRTGQASVEVDSLEVGIAQVRALVQRLGGYVANSQMQLGGSQYRSATLELKVPSPRWDELLGGLTPLGKVEFVNVSAQDVGEEFTDVSARVANARKLEGRLIDLLGSRTGKLSDVLEIERELARVREQIERLEGRLRYLQSHVATSTLSVTVHEPAPVIGDGGSGGVIGEAFRDAWRNFVAFTAGLIASLGTLIPVAVLAAAALWLLRRLWMRRQRTG